MSDLSRDLSMFNFRTRACDTDSATECGAVCLLLDVCACCILITVKYTEMSSQKAEPLDANESQ